MEARRGGAAGPDPVGVGRIPSRPVAPGWDRGPSQPGLVAIVLHFCALRPALEAGLTFLPRPSSRQVPGFARVAAPQRPPPGAAGLGRSLGNEGRQAGGERCRDPRGWGTGQGAQLGRCTAETCEARAGRAVAGVTAHRGRASRVSSGGTGCRSPAAAIPLP